MSALSVPTRSAEPTAGDDWQARVARAFSRAAPRYTERAHAQRAMAEVLCERLPERARSLLDLGCGPGELTVQLAERFSQGCMPIGLDLAPGMLDQAARRHGSRACWVCADAAALPLPARRLELVVSNLAIQWCPDLDAVMAELHRVLAPGGRALINTLAPATLAEVGWAWSRPDGLLAFRDADRYREAARAAGFSRVVVEPRAMRFTYPDLAAVMASIKGVGAQVARPAGRLTRRDWTRAAQRYERLRETEGLPVTYQLLTLELHA